MLTSWDAQQESFNPDRERRFSSMFDVLGASVPKRFTALDLGPDPVRSASGFSAGSPRPASSPSTTTPCRSGSVGGLSGASTAG